MNGAAHTVRPQPPWSDHANRQTILAVHYVFVGFMVAPSVWPPHREHPKATLACGRASSRSGERVKKHSDGGVHESRYRDDIPDRVVVRVSFEDEGNRGSSRQLGYRTRANRGRSIQVPERPGRAK